MPPGPPVEGVKERVGLIATDAVVTELARTLGFFLPYLFRGVHYPTGGIDPATGKPGWYRSIWLESELDTRTSASAWENERTSSTSTPFLSSLTFVSIKARALKMWTEPCYDAYIYFI